MYTLHKRKPSSKLLLSLRRSLHKLLTDSITAASLHTAVANNLANMFKKPKLIAFDLDYTLWPFWVDTHVDPPFRKLKDGQVVDARSKKVHYYKEVPNVLEKLYNEGYILAAASRTGEVDGANQLLKLFDWDKYFTYKEIYPGCKVTHFQRIKANCGLDFSEMLFFDDEYRNKRDLDTIGVLMILVENGVTQEVIRKGLEEFSARNERKQLQK